MLTTATTKVKFAWVILNTVKLAFITIITTMPSNSDKENQSNTTGRQQKVKA